jgi:hypothetical protein
MHGDIFSNNHSLDQVEIRCLVFKGEDQNDDGVEVGPLYAVIEGCGEIRSKRYVTISEATALARRCAATLIQS